MNSKALVLDLDGGFGHGSGKTFLPQISKPLHILVMEYAIPKIVGLHLVQRQPCVVKHQTVGIYGFPIWIENDDGLWNEIDDLS